MIGIIVLFLAISGCGEGITFKQRYWQKAVGKEQRKPVYSSSNEDDALAELGCCLIPLGGCALGLAIKKDTTPKESVRINDYKWTLGIGYNPGICWTGFGAVLQRYNGGIPIDPTASIYWLNLLEVNIQYRINPIYKLNIGGGYMWRYLKYRHSGIVYFKDSSVGYRETNWDIYGFPLFLGIERDFKRSDFYRVQLEYYFLKAIDIEHIQNKEHLYISVWAQGFGASFTFGTRQKVFSRLSLEISSTFRAGYIKEYKNNAPDNIVWRRVTFYPIGMYFKIGLFIFLGK